MDDSSNSKEKIDELLRAVRDGDESAMDRLIPLVEGELRRLAHSILRFAPRDQTLRTNALVNEAYLKLVSQPPRDCQDQAFFLRVASRTMRSLLIDYYRERNARKRGGGLVREDAELDGLPQPEERWLLNGVRKSKESWLLDLNDALHRLTQVNETWADIVDMHFFHGLTLEKIAEVLNLTRDAVRGQWRLAKAWLRREMQGR